MPDSVRQRLPVIRELLFFYFLKKHHQKDSRNANPTITVVNR